MILADLRTLPANRPVLAEGAALLPKLVAGLLDENSLSVWILPRSGFPTLPLFQARVGTGYSGAVQPPSRGISQLDGARRSLRRTSRPAGNRSGSARFSCRSKHGNRRASSQSEADVSGLEDY
jgi:hypothetical protein